MLFAAAVGLAVSGAAAHAAEFTPAPNQSFTVDLDTQAGNFSLWRAEELNGVNAVRSQITFVRLGTDPKWSPMFRVSLVRGTERVAFSVTGLPGKNLLIPMLTTTRDSKKMGDDIYVMTPQVGERFGLEIDWTPDGAVSVMIRDKAAQEISGFERHVGKLSGPPTSLEISGSTGEVEFKPLKLGRATP